MMASSADPDSMLRSVTRTLSGFTKSVFKCVICGTRDLSGFKPKKCIPLSRMSRS